MITSRGWLIAIGIGVAVALGFGASRGLTGRLAVTVFTVVVGVAFVLAIAEDARRRGRSGWGWAIACTLAAPVGLPLFVVVGLIDRYRGRVGIEGRWESGRRWWFITSVVLAIAGTFVALSEASIPPQSARSADFSLTLGGSCSVALGTAFGSESFPTEPTFSGETQTEIQQEAALTAKANQACTAASAKRVGTGVLCLGAAFGLAMIGAARKPKSSASFGALQTA